MQKPRKVKAAATRKARRAAAKRHNRLRRWEASEYLWEVHGVKYAPATLAKYASWGTGPTFRYLDGWIPIYAPRDLDNWLKPSIGKPRRHTRQQPRDKAAAHQRPTASPAGTPSPTEAPPARNQTSLGEMACQT
jgi:hypothetical protein